MKGVLVSFLVSGAVACAADNASYANIQGRNAFGLKDPPPKNVEQAPPAQEASTKILLTGITTVLGKKQALLQLVPQQMKQGEQPESLMLNEGERQGAVEVHQIDEKNGKVRISHNGMLMTLAFEASAFASANNSAPGTNLPGNVPSGPAGVPGTRFASSTNAAGLPTASMRPFPVRPGRLPGSDAAVTNQVQPPLQSAAPTQQQLSAEEQAALMQVQQEINNAQNANPPATLPALPQAGGSQTYQQQQPPLPLPTPPSPGRSPVAQ